MIGMDAGGSKTETILFDETGRVLVRDLDKGANGMDIGKKAAEEIILSILDRVMTQAPERVCAIFGGIVGTSLGNFMEVAIRGHISPEIKLKVEGDGGIIIYGMVGHRDGCSMISGTGCSMFVRRGEEPLIKIGGRGYLVDAQGSGYGLGRDALCAAFRYHDGRGPKTLLGELVNEKLGKPIQDAMPEIYDHRTGGRSFIAKFAETVFAARREGDELAIQIYDRHADALADMTYAAERYFEERFPVVMNGGLFGAFPEWAKTVSEKSSPRADMMLASVPPVYGSLVEAMWLAGLPVTDEFKMNFLTTYLPLTAKTHMNSSVRIG